MKRTAIAILIAVLVVAIGGGLCFAGLSAVHFDFKKLDRTEYLTRTYDFSDPIREIDLTCGTADVELIAAEDGRCRLVCFENERERYAVSNDDGRLTIRRETDERGWSLFSFAFKSPKITISLPAGTYELLQAELSTGELVLSGVQTKRLSAHGSTGNIRLSDMAPETVDVSVSTGRIELTNVVCSGDLRAKSTTGDIRLTDVDGANLYLSASTGDIRGTIRTEKVFSAHASTGKVVVPATTAGGRCEAETSTGDIRLSISGE